MSEKINITTKEFEDIALDVASDLTVGICKEAKDIGEESSEAMAIAEGAAVMLSTLIAQIKNRMLSPRGFICDKELLPQRATIGSAGYDFVAPHNVVIPFAGTVEVKTDVKAYMLPDEVLKIYPRSSMAIKRGVTLVNGVAVIDSDFKDEIVLALRNNSMGTMTIKKGEKIAQGIFQKYLTCGDEPPVIRKGGIGSTGK